MKSPLSKSLHPVDQTPAPRKQRVKRPPITGAQTEDVRSDWSSLKGWRHRIGHDPGNVHRCRWYRVFLVINDRVAGLIIENFSPVKMAYVRSYQKSICTFYIHNTISVLHTVNCWGIIINYKYLEVGASFIKRQMDGLIFGVKFTI